MHLSTLPIFHMNHQPHISGYQFAFMVSGDWIDDATQYLGREDLGFPIAPLLSIEKVKTGIATFIKEVEYTNPMMEFDSITGWEKAISTPSKENVSTDLTLTIHDNIQNDYMTYHALWYTYIKTAKLGLIDIPPTVKMDMFYDVSFQNKLYLITFDAKMTIKSLVIVMGLMPTSIPTKEYSGKFGTTTSEHVQVRFKTVDIIQQLYYDENSITNSELFKEFEHDFGDTISITHH